jgi:Zn-dependent metalloprotease
MNTKCSSGRCRNSLHCFVPPHILDHMAQSGDPAIRRIAVNAIAHSEALRAARNTLAAMPIMAAIPSPEAGKHRLIYDMRNKRFMLPGTLVLAEYEDKVIKDDAVKEAFDFSGLTYDFYREIFHRNSLDDNGMALISSVHFGRDYNNAFFNGEQMVYGDGDNRIFARFTKSVEVVGHELSHCVVQHTCNLDYQDEPGALNEHFADVMGTLVAQWHKGESINQANWLIGDEVMGPDVQAKAIRTFKNEKAYENDPVLGTDPQPKHMKDKYEGDEDNGGVHINSGIPNHAFYLAAMDIGGNSWEKTGTIWYKTLLGLNRFSKFKEAAEMTYQVASALFGAGSMEAKAVQKAWNEVGITI